MSNQQSVTLSPEDWNKVVNTLAKEPYNEVFTTINQILQQLAEAQQQEQQQEQQPTHLKEVQE